METGATTRRLVGSAIVAPAVRHEKKVESDVRPDANRVIFSPLLDVTVTNSRKVPFGCLATITLTEEWFPVNDIPPHARHRVSPDPSDPATWGGVSPDKLPKPKLASALVNSNLILDRVLAMYSDYGCREINALRDRTVEEIRATQEKLFGGEQMLTYAETVEVIKIALANHSDDRLVINTAREIMALSDQAVRASQLYWQQRKIEILRAANGDKSFTGHADNYDLRICEYAGIDVTMTEADALRADVIRATTQQPVVAVAPPALPEGFAETMRTVVKEGIAEGIKAGLAAAATTPVAAEQKPAQGEQKSGRNNGR